MQWWTTLRATWRTRPAWQRYALVAASTTRQPREPTQPPAEDGTRRDSRDAAPLTSFHTAAVCGPSRSVSVSLLSSRSASSGGSLSTSTAQHSIAAAAAAACGGARSTDSCRSCLAGCLHSVSGASSASYNPTAPQSSSSAHSTRATCCCSTDQSGMAESTTHTQQPTERAAATEAISSADCVSPRPCVVRLCALCTCC